MAKFNIELESEFSVGDKVLYESKNTFFKGLLFLTTITDVSFTVHQDIPFIIINYELEYRLDTSKHTDTIVACKSQIYKFDESKYEEYHHTFEKSFKLYRRKEGTENEKV